MHDEILGLLKGVVEELDFERSCMITLCKYLPQLLDFPHAALDVPACGKNRLSVSLAALDVRRVSTFHMRRWMFRRMERLCIVFRVMTMALDVPPVVAPGSVQVVYEARTVD
ncbi:Glutamate receptor family protein [Prunus dulcis]|uniref:Glutamate receptor family protein n=1 Tax=Prunus dulcis TaxID=3755 RepID=A0A4Y1RQP1_PRUDU|nr:Glutamate receptor family protein [Prunus dulcis]